uniref:Centrosomal protein 192 n=1 Tax=Elaeophora elaphi TaxID=1147741 RepID=A0A0R3RKA8_9BILA
MSSFGTATFSDVSKGVPRLGMISLRDCAYLRCNLMEELFKLLHGSREPSCTAICGVSRRGASMTDYGSFAQGDGFFTGQRGRSDEKDFASTGQQLPSGNVVKQLPATSFGQNFPPYTSQNTDKLQFPKDNICTPDLEDVRRAAKRFIETTVSSTYGLQGQSVDKWDIYNGDVEDAEFAHVLDNLPTSYDDFESKELHLKLERNLSSPLMTCQSPNADSGRVSAGSSLTKSSNMYLCDVGSNPPDADDLEVAMINQSFEEQQKQTKLYASPGLKDLFYSQPNTTDDRVAVKNFDKEAVSTAKYSLLVASDTHKSDCSEGPLFPADLLLTGISANSIISKESLTVGSPWTVCQEKFVKAELDTLAAVKSSNIQEVVSNSMSPKTNAGFGSASQEAFGSSLVAMKAMSALMESQHDASAAMTDDRMDATEALALDVVESLFDGSGLAETSFTTEDCDNQDLVRNINENNVLKPGSDELTSLTELMDNKRESVGEEKERKDEAVVPSCGAVDSWEELDNDDYSSKLVNEIEIAMCKVKIRKPKINYFSGPPVDPWDDNVLPHVLEAFNLPVRFTEDDVKQELAKYDCADVSIHPVDETHCLVVFASKNAALQAMIAVRQRQSIAKIRLRSLCDATRITQEKARKYQGILRPHTQRPQTTPLVARRLIESALGKRSNVSAQQISFERKQLKDAKGHLKLAKAAFWEDGP